MKCATPTCHHAAKRAGGLCRWCTAEKLGHYCSIGDCEKPGTNRIEAGYACEMHHKRILRGTPLLNDPQFRYSKDYKKEILTRLRAGEPLRAVSRDEEIPRQTLYWWRRRESKSA